MEPLSIPKLLPTYMIILSFFIGIETIILLQPCLDAMISADLEHAKKFALVQFFFFDLVVVH